MKRKKQTLVVLISFLVFLLAIWIGVLLFGAKPPKQITVPTSSSEITLFTNDKDNSHYALLSDFIINQTKHNYIEYKASPIVKIDDNVYQKIMICRSIKATLAMTLTVNKDTTYLSLD